MQEEGREYEPPKKSQEKANLDLGTQDEKIDGGLKENPTQGFDIGCNHSVEYYSKGIYVSASQRSSQEPSSHCPTRGPQVWMIRQSSWGARLAFNDDHRADRHENVEENLLGGKANLRLRSTTRRNRPWHPEGSRRTQGTRCSRHRDSWDVRTLDKADHSIP